jgi:hypothetical protein
MRVSGQPHIPAALYPRGKNPPVPIGREAGWASEPVWTQTLKEKSSLPLPGIEPWSPGRPARSQTLYCLSYPGSFIIDTVHKHCGIQMKEDDTCSRMGHVRNAWAHILVRKTEEHRRFGTSKRRWEDNIKVDSRICGGQCGTVTGFTQSSSVLPCYYHLTVAVHTHISSGEWTMVTAVQRHILTPSTWTTTTTCSKEIRS